jgi:DNA-binding response OmpR family regulator
MTDRRRVLILEDDHQIATVLADALHDEGYEIQWVPDGRQGLAILKQWTPHLIILDLMMPVMDGPAFRAAQGRLPPSLAGVPVLVLSGARDARAQAENLAAAAAIAKPFELDDVLNAVARICGNVA